MGNVHVVGPNEALIVTGGCRCPRKRIVAGGGCVWACCVGTKVQVLSLALMTLTPTCEDAETVEGVAITVTGTALCKISKLLIDVAAEQFLDRSPEQIGNAVQLTLEGHLRAILGTLTVEEVFKDREKFASAVKKIAAIDVAKMGIEIVSFTIKDIYDNVLYLSSLGKTRTAQVLTDAKIGIAEAERDAGIKESQCERIAMAAMYDSYTKIANNDKIHQLQKANYEIQMNAAKAQVHLAYELQAMKVHQRIKLEECKINVIEKKKEIEIEEQEILRKELELKSSVRLTVEAKIYGRRMLGLGNNYHIKEMAKAYNVQLKSIGLAEAHMLQLVGTAKAERSRLKAIVFKDYGKAAINSILQEALPKIAAHISAPLSRIDEIVLLGSKDHLAGGLNLLSNRPSQAELTVVHLANALNKDGLLNNLRF